MQTVLCYCFKIWTKDFCFESDWNIGAREKIKTVFDLKISYFSSRSIRTDSSLIYHIRTNSYLHPHKNHNNRKSLIENKIRTCHGTLSNGQISTNLRALQWRHDKESSSKMCWGQRCLFEDIGSSLSTLVSEVFGAAETYG